MTLKVDVVENTSGGPVTLTDQRAIKGWANSNLVSFSVRDSFNLSSMTDISAGRQRFNATSSFTDSNFACCGSSGKESGNGQLFRTDASNKSSSVQESTCLYTNDTNQDTALCNMMLIGDLA